MKKLVLALVAAATLGLAAPAFTSDAQAAAGTTVTRTKVVKTGHGRVVKKVTVRRDHGSRHGWRHRHATRTVVVKRRPNGTVVRKVVVRRNHHHHQVVR